MNAKTTRNKRNKYTIAVVTGAAGFAGYSLTSHLVKKGYEVYAIVRPGSEHNERLKNLSMHIIELDTAEYGKLPSLINKECDLFFHLAWSGGRDAFDEQFANIDHTITAVEVASRLGCKRFIATGSQAEYGVQEGIITEDILPAPINAYGAAKVSAMYLTKRRAEQLGIQWIWARIFSLYGRYEPSGRMLPDLVDKLIKGDIVELSSCLQNWDYLDVNDAADALIWLAKKGIDGEIYNVANGNYKPLKKYVQKAVDIIASNSEVIFGDNPNPFISLQPDVSKIKEHTGWKPKTAFSDGIKNMLKDRVNE